jgi:uncharacterized protein YkwD
MNTTQNPHTVSWWRPLVVASLLTISIGLAGCNAGSPTEPTSTNPPTEPTNTNPPTAATSPAAPTVPNGTSHPAEQAQCVAFTNAYRATLQLPPYSRASALDTFATAAAQNDGQSHMAHQYFYATNGGGFSHSENMIPWWPLDQYRTIEQILRTGIAQMWAEGPGGGHYENMRSTSYRTMGCGIHVNNGEVTVAQEFR